MLVSQLVTNAYILSGIVSRGLNSVSNQQGTDGLFLFNQLQDEIVLKPDYIPYYSLQTMTTVTGQEKYFFANVAEISTVTFTLQNVRYSLVPDNRRHYYGAPRAENISSLPFDVFWERTLGGSNLYLYFFPSQNLVLNVNCKLFLPDSTMDTDLSTLYDGAYQSYLQYCLAKKVCEWNKISPTEEVLQKLREFQQTIENLNPRDFTCHKSYSLSKGESLTYADVNFGRGWTAP